jgi:hypothetical protein
MVGDTRRNRPHERGMACMGEHPAAFYAVVWGQAVAWKG